MGSSAGHAASFPRHLRCSFDSFRVFKFANVRSVWENASGLADGEQLYVRMVTTLRLQWIVNSMFRPTWLLDESDRGGVAMNDEELKTEIREDGAKLNRLEREEQEIESSDHHGFRDAESRIR